MSDTVSDFLIARLNEWGIRRIYGFPGDGINGIIGARGRAGDKVDYVQVRHEEMSAFMACAHSKFTGEVGVCLATSGPGAVHLLNGLYDAKMDHQSVVAIVGQKARMAMRGGLPAGGRSRVALQGCGGRLRTYGQRGATGAAPRGPCGAHCQGGADRHLPYHPERSTGVVARSVPGSGSAACCGVEVRCIRTGSPQ